MRIISDKFFPGSVKIKVIIFSKEETSVPHVTIFKFQLQKTMPAFNIKPRLK